MTKSSNNRKNRMKQKIASFNENAFSRTADIPALMWLIPSTSVSPKDWEESGKEWEPLQLLILSGDPNMYEAARFTLERFGQFVASHYIQQYLPNCYSLEVMFVNDVIQREAEIFYGNLPTKMPATSHLKVYGETLIGGPPIKDLSKYHQYISDGTPTIVIATIFAALAKRSNQPNGETFHMICNNLAERLLTSPDFEPDDLTADVPWLLENYKMIKAKRARGPVQDDDWIVIRESDFNET